MQKNILKRWPFIIISLSMAIIILINDYKYYSGVIAEHEPFDDLNEDGKWTPAEPFDDLNEDGKWTLAEPFDDLNEDGKWTPAEPFDDLNKNGKWDFKLDREFLFDSNIINLGLDLRGGSEYLLSPKIDKWVLQNATGSNQEDLAEAILKMREASESFDLSTLNTYLEKINKNLTIGHFFKKDNGYVPTIEELENSIQQALLSNKDIIRRRIDTRGVIEPSVRVNGGKISVEIPGDQSVEDIEDLITTSAELEFSEVIHAPPQDRFDISKPSVDSWQRGNWKTIKQYPDLAALLDTVKILLGTEYSEIKYIKATNVQKFKDKADLKSRMFTKQKIGYFKPDNRFGVEFNDEDLWIGILNTTQPDVSGDNVSNASTESDGGLQDNYVILLDFDGEGSRNWANYTSSAINKKVAITLDNLVLTYPTIRGRIDGTSEITGFTDYNKANNVTIALNNGKFNLPLQIDSKYKTGPELGEEQTSLGLFAFIIGVVCVIVFMIIYYRASGIIASTALVINLLLMSAILSLLGATLTLPGIAGFILTVGIAVDANVIIFERIKEEIQRGTPPISSIEAGYDRAFITILDANITTLLTAFILYSFGTGPIKGFAITLGAGIACSMFTAIYVTRTIFGTLYYSKFPKKLSI